MANTVLRQCFKPGQFNNVLGMFLFAFLQNELLSDDLAEVINDRFGFDPRAIGAPEQSLSAHLGHSQKGLAAL